jgi:hypothetical protein
VTATFDAAEPWRVHLDAAFQDLVPEALDQMPDPRGSLSGVRLGPVGVFTVSGTPQVVRRTTSAVRQSPGDLIKVCVQLQGRATVQQGAHEVALGPGELAAGTLGYESTLLTKRTITWHPRPRSSLGWVGLSRARR